MTADSFVNQATTSSAPVGLSTFLGVFTPTILTILGAIMYLRFGWVVANGGIWGAVAIVVIANLITAVTALSVSALSTNMRVGAGGAYFMISRSLGLEIGGAIGLPLFLSQAISLTLYCYGLAECIQMFWPEAPVSILAGTLVLVVSALAARSTVFALKMQIPIMAFVGLSILSLLLGADWGGSPDPSLGTYQDASFWGLFAVFFPAVTGILAGVSLSGDLADPERSLPRGTLLAVIAGAVIYLIIPVALGLSGDFQTLSKPLAWMEVAWIGVLIIPGLWGAVLSSAIGSILAAPRTLQAMAEDKLVSPKLGELDARDGEPKRALWLSAAVAFAAVFLGDLNAVATTVSMFFLTTYGMINIVCGLEGLVGDPSFRPRFQVNWILPLAGAAACLWVMMLIHPVAATVAIVCEIGIWAWLSRRALQASWGDMRGGTLMSLAIWSLVQKRRQREHPRSWRPHILIFTSDVGRNMRMVDLTWAFSLRRGVVTVCSLVEGDLDEEEPLVQRAMEEESYLTHKGVTAFCEVHVVPDIESGMVTVAQANGIAGLASNTVMLGFPDNDEFLVPVVRVMRRLDRLGKSLLLARIERQELPRDRSISIWWAGRENNGDLMLLLAHLLRQNAGWRRSRLTLRSIVADPDEADVLHDEMKAMVEEIRIPAQVQVLPLTAGSSVGDIIQTYSRRDTLTMLGLGLPPVGEEREYVDRIQSLIGELDNVLLVRNSGPFKGKLL